MRIKHDNSKPTPYDDLAAPPLVEAREHGEQEHRRLNRLMEEDPSQASAILLETRKQDPLYTEISQIYMKYLRPKRLKRNKTRNQLLSKWEGRKTNDFTGIAEPSASLLPSKVPRSPLLTAQTNSFPLLTSLPSPLV